MRYEFHLALFRQVEISWKISYKLLLSDVSIRYIHIYKYINVYVYKCKVSPNNK
jgi:hypothetical protein